MHHMIDVTKPMEKFLQDYRFRMAKPYLTGDVLDFGGNQGELGKFVHDGDYLAVNHDYTPMEGRAFDTIVSLATIEHLEVDDVYLLFWKFRKMLRKNGRIFITTPTPAARPILEFMAAIGVVDKVNIMEHKYYWDEDDLMKLAKDTGFHVLKYKQFQLGFNQMVVLE